MTASKKRRPLVLAAMLGLIAVNACKHPAEVGLASADVGDRSDQPCPSTAAGWQQWQNAAIDGLLSSNFADVKVAATTSTLQKCSADRGAVAQKNKVCLANLERFATALMWPQQAGHSLGFSTTDQEYYVSSPFPEMLQPPKELTSGDFLRWLDDDAVGPGTGREKALAYIDHINAGIVNNDLKWIPFMYRSQHLPTPDGSGALGRFFVYVPDPRFDRFIQFGLRNAPSDPLPNSYSVVTVQKTDPSSNQKLSPPKVWLNDLWRLRNGGGITLSTRLKEAGSLENCYDCHKSAVLAITPDPLWFDAARFGDSLKRVNRIIGTAAAAQYVGIDMAAFGPGLGPTALSSRTPDFVKACSGNTVTDPARIAVLQRAMSCERCHNGDQRGPLNFPSALRDMPQPFGRSLVDRYITVHKTMPPGATLSDAERTALHRCLKLEYFGGVAGQPGVLRDWLAQAQCWAP